MPNWVTWKAEGGPDEKPRKVPYTPQRRRNSRASSTDPKSWGTFEHAQEAYMFGNRTGIGIVLDGSGLVGVDIDHCVTDGTPDPAALALLDSLDAAYVELSPSGTGLRAFGYADNLKSGAKGKLNGLDVELYSTGRYLTLTGHTIKTGSLGQMVGFTELADLIRSDRKVNPATNEVTLIPPDQRHASLVQRILKGDVFHDSLRDMAASFVATGLQPGAVVNHLRALMDSCTAPHDDRWQARRAQIPELVNSAGLKFEPLDFEALVLRSASNAPRYKLLSGDEIRALPALIWCVRGVLPVVGLAALFGPSASGKSFLGFDLAAAIAEGKSWFGCRVKTRQVVYAALEGEAGFKLRAQAWEVHHERNLPQGLHLMIQPFKLTELQDVADFAAVVPDGAVVFIDTLNRAAPTADENTSRDMGEILEAAKRLQSVTRGLVVLIHHTGKDSSKGLRGHSSLFAAMDAAVEVSRDGDRREWKVSKSKDGADGVVHPFQLKTVDLGVDTYGDPITSCVVVTEKSGVNSKHTVLSRGGKLALEALKTVVKQDGKEPNQIVKNHYGKNGDFVLPLWPEKVVTEEVWRQACYQAGIAEADAEQDSKRRAFTRARGHLIDAAVVGTFDGYVWPQ